MIKRPGIPHPQTSDKNVQRVLLALKQNIDIQNGVVGGVDVNQDGWKMRSVTLDMLIKLGLVTEAQAHSVAQEP